MGSGSCIIAGLGRGLMNIPIGLTLVRIALIPVFVALFYLPAHWGLAGPALVFALAGLTDWLDGWLARRLDQATRLGAFLDPVADKLMVAIALVLLAERYHAWWFTLPAMVIIGREIMISALREWMAEVGERARVAVSARGTWKTTFERDPRSALLLANPDSRVLRWCGVGGRCRAAALTRWALSRSLDAASCA